MDIIEAIRRFLDAKRLDRGASNATIRAYRTDLLQFAATLPAGSRPIAGIQPSHLDAFVAQLAAEAQKSSSLARKVSALRQFFKFCRLELQLENHPAENLVSPKLARALPKSLSRTEVDSLLAMASDPKNGGPRSEALRARDRAMVYLMYASGLRVSELLSLRVSDTDLKEGFLRVTGKGGKNRIAPFAPVAGEILGQYLEQHRGRLNPQTDHLFLNPAGTALSRQAFWRTIQTLAAAAGINRAVSPHTLRHSFATHLLQSGINLRSLQMLLGHSDLSTTQIYTEVTPEHLKETHRKYHPRG